MCESRLIPPHRIPAQVREYSPAILVMMELRQQAVVIVEPLAS